jgi:hypothetical protein
MLDKTGGSSAPNQGAKAYSYAELVSATNNFKSRIGSGGFGPVFWGKLATGQEVAVKVSDANSRQGAQEFNTEVGFGDLGIFPIFTFAKVRNFGQITTYENMW